MPQILKLLADNKTACPKSKIVSSAGEITIYLYDAIVATEADAKWFGGVSAEGLVKEIRTLKPSTIHLRINCPGGDVFAGRAIEQALREHDGKIVAHIDGYAASAASFIMLAADEIEIGAGAFIMIHNAWTFAMGNSQDIMKVAGLLDKIDASIAESYATKTSKDLKIITDWMANETWFSAKEAVDNGFADRISSDNSSSNTENSWNLSAYANAPKGNDPSIGERMTNLENTIAEFIKINDKREIETIPVDEPVSDNSLQAGLLRQLQLATVTV